MFYPFPYIKHIDQVKEALLGRDEFIITEKPGGYIVANYLVNMEDTFPKINLIDGKYATKQDELNAIRRECRGIKFDAQTGLVVARPFHKFFNVNEREETQIGDVLNGATWILEKLDGSMIHPIVVANTIRWCTKMGITEVSVPVETYAYSNPEYNKLAQHCIDINHTPIFEWCSRKQRIVLDYPEDKLVLTGIRENYSGRYLSMGEMESIISRLMIHVPLINKIFSLDLVNLGNETDVQRLEEDLAKIKTDDGLIDIIRQKENAEGYVFRFYDGHMLKAKSEWYVRIHKAKDCLSFEKDVIEALVNEKMDDVKPFLMESDLQHVNEFEEQFWKGVQTFVDDLTCKYKKGKSIARDDKKIFAVEYVNKQDSLIRPLLFQIWAGKEPRTVVLDMIKKNIGSRTEVDGIRNVFNANWNTEKVEE